MKTTEKVQEYFEHATQKYPEEQAVYYTQCFEACIPRLFWEVRSSGVTHNVDIFEGAILNYCKKWRRALKFGYGLLLTGDNGVGKTMFLSFVLTQMIKRGCSVYYTTLPQLDVDIKRGFRDRVVEARLCEMMDSDFVAIDELGKEFKSKEAYIRTRFELAVKKRYDDGDPTLFGSNYTRQVLVKEYGSSVASMWRGKNMSVILQSGDQRRSSARKMKKDMGF